MLRSVARNVVKIMGWASAYAYTAFVIVASAIAVLCGIGMVALFIVVVISAITGA